VTNDVWLEVLPFDVTEKKVTILLSKYFSEKYFPVLTETMNQLMDDYGIEKFNIVTNAEERSINKDNVVKLDGRTFEGMTDKVQHDIKNSLSEGRRW
jgi:hypothetical protein